LGILYAKKPMDEAYERLALFVPETFLKCKANGKDTYTCEPDKRDSVGHYDSSEAPVIIPVETPKFEANPALTSYKNFSKYTKAGFVYAHVGFRGIEHGIPAGLVDIKAAIRFIRKNQGKIPASTDHVIVFGVGEGGGLAALVGTTADSQLYKPYLSDIGAIEYGHDRVFGVMAWSPNTGWETANEAYEWNMGYVRPNMNENQKALSERMAREYARYINDAGFRGFDRKPLILQYSKRGIYHEGTYYEYVKSLIEDSLNEFINTSTYPLEIAADGLPSFMAEYSGVFADKVRYLRRLNEKLNWIRYDRSEGRYVIRSIDDFVRLMKPAQKPLGAFDSMTRTQMENFMFGSEEGHGYHFDKYMVKILKGNPKAGEYFNDLKKHDAFGNSVQDRLNMYSPLYFVLPSSEGYLTSKVAPYWRIRSGINQTETALTTEVNLALGVFNYPEVKRVDFKMIWGKGKIKAEENHQDSTTAFINWVDKIMAYKGSFSVE
jgi:ribosome-associated translation inhibitor RaiA